MYHRSNNNIKNNLESHKLKIYPVTTQEELDDILNNVNKRYSNHFYYQFLLSVNVGNINLNGGTWLVEGYLAANALYGTQTIKLYSSKILDERHRSLRNGIWSDWCNTISNSDLKPQIKSYSTNYGLNVRKIKTLTNLNIEISGRPNTSINSEWVALCNVEETTLSTINYVFFTADNGVRYLCYVDNKGDLYFKPSSNILATDFIYCTMTYII